MGDGLFSFPGGFTLASLIQHPEWFSSSNVPGQRRAKRVRWTALLGRFDGFKPQEVVLQQPTSFAENQPSD